MNFREEIEGIKAKMYSGLINYDQAKSLAAPIIDRMNTKAKEIAKQFNRHPTRFNFAGLMR